MESQKPRSFVWRALSRRGADWQSLLSVAVSTGAGIWIGQRSGFVSGLVAALTLLIAFEAVFQVVFRRGE